MELKDFQKRHDNGRFNYEVDSETNALKVSALMTNPLTGEEVWADPVAINEAELTSAIKNAQEQLNQLQSLEAVIISELKNVKSKKPKS